jgi:AraC family transcriptional regulator, regulatory protein of adaptative response / DNA-3-methyladenine glycosylase II
VADGGYARTIVAGGEPGTMEVRRPSAEPYLLLTLRLRARAELLPLVERVRRLFDLDAYPHEITAHLCGDPVLAATLAAHPGLRVPGAWDGFELAVRAILGQQVTVKGATTLAGRLVERFGRPVAEGAGGLTHLFPTPEALAGADLASIGLPRPRAEALRGLAIAAAEGRPLFDRGDSLDETLARLTALPGVGPWTAQYVAMRAAREPDAFPAGDLGLRRRFARDGEPASERDLAARAEAWRPFRAYAAMALWLGGHPGASSPSREE